MKTTIERRQSANKTHEKIIKVSRKLFAVSGFSGTTTAAIAKAAKVNEALIFHHFGNKIELWKTVKSSIVDSLNVTPINKEPESLRLFLTEVISKRLMAYAKEPDLIRLLQWQRLESIRDKLAAGNMLAPNDWQDPILHLQHQQQISPDLNPKLIIIWIAASINAIIYDDTLYLQDVTQREKYIEMITLGLEKALWVRPNLVFS